MEYVVHLFKLVVSSNKVLLATIFICYDIDVQLMWYTILIPNWIWKQFSQRKYKCNITKKKILVKQEIFSVFNKRNLVQICRWKQWHSLV